ncbi:family S53 protease-like protein [Mycena latifolia]|nr:family S53 protease-like protein [Mycena latifolia]
MMALRTFLVLLSLGAVSSGRMIVHENRPAAPSGFVSQGAAPADDLLALRFALAPNNLAGLQTKLASVSTPGSSEFRKWLSKDEVKSFMRPSAETIAAFNAFASANGLKPTEISPNEDWVSLTLPVSQANKLFAANFEVFTHVSSTQMLTRTLSVSLPFELVGHVDVISPSIDFVDPNPRLTPLTNVNLQKRDPAASCNTSIGSGIITPACLQDIYGIPTAPATQPNNTLQFAQSADLSTFLSLLRPDIPSNTTFSLLTADNGTNPQNPSVAGAEAGLDIQYAMGIATGVPTMFLSFGGSGSSDGFAQALLDTTIFLDGIDNPPSVMTTSYSSSESDFGISMATKICNGYMALGSRGISVLTSSGDGGVHGDHDISFGCVNTFDPFFPPVCPFVTAVGSTIGFGPEIAANFTGGGFANFFPAPSYQSATIAGFLETLPSSFAGTFNRTGRGYPDVAVQGCNFEMIFDGGHGIVSRTSASSPTFAGIIALINDRLMAAEKPVLGFLNPWLYSTASTAFSDITIGHNSGFECPASSVTFDAAVGWDPL